MKTTTLSLALLLFCGFLYGQEDQTPKNTVRAGINRAFFGYGDITGPGIYCEYSHALNDYFALTPRLMSAYANRISEANYNHASSFGASLAVRITPLPHTFRRLKIDIGGLYHSFISTYGQVGELMQHGVYLSSRTTYKKEDLFGLIGSLSVNVIDTKKIEIGLRFDMMTSFVEEYFNCDSWQTGVYIGFRF
jgi:hypothetical protein